MSIMKMVMREELRSTNMPRSYTIAYHLTEITWVHDKLVVVGETMGDQESVRIDMNVFTKLLVELNILDSEMLLFSRVCTLV